jgi:hypothetical protein
MSKRMGRPTIPKNEAKSQFCGAFFTPDELKFIERARQQTGLDKSKWLRRAAIDAAQPVVWVRTRWKQIDLDGKPIEFRLSGPDYFAAGIGTLVVRKNARGELSIQLCLSQAGGANDVEEIRYSLGQGSADRIEPHPNPGIAPFRLSDSPSRRPTTTAPEPVASVAAEAIDVGRED